jgi:uncharacterized protein YheU (UPF0270 family)
MIFSGTAPGLAAIREEPVRMSDQPQQPVFVPYTELSAEALRGVVESFVLREGTDYGEREFSLEQKLAHVYRQLERGEAQIVFDPNTETVDIILQLPPGSSAARTR